MPARRLQVHEQGRAIFENIRRFVVYLLSCNLWHAFNLRGLRSRAFDNDIVRSPWIWGALALCAALLALAALWPPLAGVLGVTDIGARGWAIAGVMSPAPVVVVQLALAVLSLRGRSPRGARAVGSPADPIRG